ncbi:SCO4225 family membrane protein [Streptomyces sp. NPDC058442]|uniref:SCO4225 family membrane protein n=1 Tax=Streptomyces sp. NPDC058442 TaxID=3346503 RepID=UPI003658F212
MPNDSRPRSLPHRLLVLATGNWLARSYLAVFTLSVLVMLLFPESGFAVSFLLLTAPLSLLTMVLPFGPGTEGGGAVEVLAIGFWAAWLLLCASVNAAVLGALLQRSATSASTGFRKPSPPVSDLPEPEGTGTAHPASPRPHRARALLAPAVDNWLARGYLAVVAASLGFFLVAVYLLPDPGFAAIWPTMTTAPLGVVALLVPSPVEWTSSLAWLNPLVFSAGAALSGLFNAVLLGRLARTLRARDAPPAA